MNCLKEILSPRQMRIVDLLCEGCTNKEIATAIGTSEQVVKNQLHTIFDTAGVWSRHELAMRMMRDRITEQQCMSQRKDAQAVRL